jgi:hypothetical protein
MHEHGTRHDTSAAAPARAARVPQGSDLSAAGNRALAAVLAPRPVQRWPDMDDLGGLLGGGPSMGNTSPDLGGYLPEMPSLPSMPDIGGLLPELPSLNIPGINLNVDSDRGTASGGIDFHDGTSGTASYGPGGIDVAGQTGSSSAGGHASAPNDWNVHAGTTTSAGSKVGGNLSDSHGRFGGSLGVLGPGGDRGSLSGHAGRGGFGGLGSYAGQFGNLELPF